jgi:hypothetical protein
MSKPPIPKEQDPTEWGIFFKTEMKMNKIRRGIDQAEKFSADEIRVLIGEMVLECQKPPYNQIEKVIIQNVVKDAVLNDPDFFYFTVSWIRKILNKWWYLSGWKHVEKLEREREAEAERNKPVPVSNPHLDVDAMLESYKRSLLLEASKIKEVPKMERKQIVKEGAEWKSNLERKGLTYSNGLTPEYVELKSKIQITATRFYEKRTSFSDLKVFPVNDFEIFAASEKDAIEIYSLAIKKD